MAIDRAAFLAGSIRLASGVSFLIDPVRANRLWGDPDEPAPTARLLLRSMGYRDALIGGLLTAAALRGQDTRGWFLASAGADGADLLGGMGVHHEMKRSQRVIGLGGAVIGKVCDDYGRVLGQRGLYVNDGALIHIYFSNPLRRDPVHMGMRIHKH